MEAPSPNPSSHGFVWSLDQYIVLDYGANPNIIINLISYLSLTQTEPD